MKKKAIISLKSFNDLDEQDVIEVVTPGEFPCKLKMVLKPFMKKQRYQE